MGEDDALSTAAANEEPSGTSHDGPATDLDRMLSARLAASQSYCYCPACTRLVAVPVGISATCRCPACDQELVVPTSSQPVVLRVLTMDDLEVRLRGCAPGPGAQSVAEWASRLRLALAENEERKQATWNRDFGLHARDGVRWVPDNEAAGCMGDGCGAEFRLLVRRHHCRNCGGVFCHGCSVNERAVPGFGEGAVRVCDRCAAEFESDCP